MKVSRLFIILLIFFLTTNCNSGQKSKLHKSSPDTLTITDKAKKQTFEILLDSIYAGKNYKIVQEYYPDAVGINSNMNTIFTFIKLNNTKAEVLFKDTVYSQAGDIEYRDFNGDNVKDILIQNHSDVRSNWTYNLYLIDTAADRLTKIKGFNEIKNPNYLSQYDLIDNFVTSGRNWVSFYKIQGDSIKEFDVVIYEDANDNGRYDREYKNAINSIMGNRNNR